MAAIYHTIPVQLILPFRPFPDLETWSPIAGWEGAYEVSSFGQVRSLTREINVTKDGQDVTVKIKGTILLGGLAGRTRRYRVVSLYKNNRREAHYVHHLVLLAFVGSRPPGTEANHIDGNPSNNAVSNLQWVTPEDNLQHAIDIGRNTGRPKT